jgi:hypothetical protein
MMHLPRCSAVQRLYRLSVLLAVESTRIQQRHPEAFIGLDVGIIRKKLQFLLINPALGY